jgi:outer membrane protein insertion porin family
MIEKIILIVLVIFFAFSCSKAFAQNSKSPPPISILKDNKSAIFNEGETIIVEIKFTGLDFDYETYTFEKPFYESEVHKLLRENRATISADEIFNSKKIEKVIRLLKEWLTAQGYLKAKVVALGEKLSKNQMKLIFSIERGAMIRVSEIRFVGNRNVTSEEFIADFKQCSRNSWERFDKREYDYFSQMCSRRLMYSKGYFQAKIKRVTPRLIEDNYVVTIEVNEGISYRIGEIKIEGAEIFTEKEILEMSEMQMGDVADGKALQEFVYEKLRRTYADKGYVLYNADFDPEYIQSQAEELDAIVNVLITIDEGKQFKLRNISFVGVEKEKAQELKEILALRKGDVFNQSKFEDGIKKINDMKEFYFIDKEQDVEISINEDGGDIDLVIKVKKQAEIS